MSITASTQHQQDKHKFWHYSFSSLIAQGATRTFLAPVERVKIIMQTQAIMRILPTDRYSTLRQAFSRIRTEQGILSFWRGNLTNIYRVVPTNWIKFLTFNYLKEELFPNKSERGFNLNTICRHFATGMGSVFMVQLFTFPFDVVRTRQICDLSKIYDQRTYNGAWDTMRKLLRTEKYVSIYKGFWVSYASAAPYLALAYTFYEQIRSVYHPSVANPEQTELYLFKTMGAGGLAAALASMITYPLDTIRRRMMVNGGIGFEREYKGAFDCIRKIATGSEGYRGFYAGFLANLIKVVPTLGIQFSIFDGTRMLIFE